MGVLVHIGQQKAVPVGTGRPDSNPVGAYLGRLAPGSRRGIVVSLNAIARYLSNGSADAMSFDWPSIRYQETSAVRNHLAKTYALHTANLGISALRGVLKECWRLGLISHDDYTRAGDMPRVKGESEVAGRSLTVDELRDLFKVCDADPSSAGIRDAALIAIMYCTGMRRSEFVALTLADYDGKKGAFTIRGKGNKTRLAFLTTDAQGRLAQWLKIRGSEGKPLFVSISKVGAFGNQPLTGHSVRFILQGRAVEAGVEPFSPHDMRRTTAIYLHGKVSLNNFLIEILARSRRTMTAGKSILTISRDQPLGFVTMRLEAQVDGQPSRPLLPSLSWRKKSTCCRETPRCRQLH
jgi:integrase